MNLADYVNYMAAKFASGPSSNASTVLDLASGAKGALFIETEANKPSPIGILDSSDVIVRLQKAFPAYKVSLVGSTNSMEPLIDYYDVALEVPYDLWKVKMGEPKVGQICVYQYGKDTLIIHRIIGKMNGKFVFKGDNNKMPDALVDESQLRSVVVGFVYTNDKITMGQD